MKVKYTYILQFLDGVVTLKFSLVICFMTFGFLTGIEEIWSWYRHPRVWPNLRDKTAAGSRNFSSGKFWQIRSFQAPAAPDQLQAVFRTQVLWSGNGWNQLDLDQGLDNINFLMFECKRSSSLNRYFHEQSVRERLNFTVGPHKVLYFSCHAVLTYSTNLFSIMKQ